MSNPPNDAYAVLKGRARHVGEFRRIKNRGDVHNLPGSRIETIYSPIHDIVIVIFESPPTLTVRPPDVTIPILLNSSVLGNRRFARQ
jgi:hypothetical protein